LDLGEVSFILTIFDAKNDDTCQGPRTS